MTIQAFPPCPILQVQRLCHGKDCYKLEYISDNRGSAGRQVLHVAWTVRGKKAFIIVQDPRKLPTLSPQCTLSPVQRDLMLYNQKRDHGTPHLWEIICDNRLFQRICHLKLKCLKSLKVNWLPKVCCHTRQAKEASLSKSWKLTE